MRRTARKKGRLTASGMVPALMLRMVSTVCIASIVSVICSSSTSKAYHDGLATDPLYLGFGPPDASKIPVLVFVVEGVQECR